MTQTTGSATASEMSSYQPLSQIVAQRLRDDIFAGKFEHGQPIRQEAVARETGVSRIPVREALQQLESEGLVTLRPHSGARVALLDFNECISVYKIRERLDPLGLSESIPNLSDDQIAEVRQLEMKLHGLADDVGAWIEADRAFHLACYVGSPLRIQQATTSYWRVTQQYRRPLVESFSETDFEIQNHEHRLIVDAIETRNCRAGEELIRSHIERSRFYFGQLQQLFDR